MPQPIDPNDDLEAELKKALERADAAFRVDYKDAMESLRALTPAQLAAITPSPTAKEAYEKLIQAVQVATARNESQAALQKRIEALGTVAYSIAQRVAGLAKYLA
jgi:hypothetical protein